MFIFASTYYKKKDSMNIRRIFLTLTTTVAISMAGIAQTARQVLDLTATKLRNSGGIEASFEGTQFKGQHEVGTATGHIQVQGEKFKISSNALTTWFDGRTQWTLMNGSDEVNVSKPSTAELQQINPYTFLNLYKQGYNLKLANTNYHGKTCHEVRMIAQNKGNGIQLVIAVIDKQTNLPLSLRMKDNHGEWTRIRINSLHTHKRWNDANFKFDQKSHPNIEVIDLR